MGSFYKYTFGYRDGIGPDLASTLWAEHAVDLLLERVLTPEEMEKRKYVKLYRQAIAKVAEEIIDSSLIYSL